jgi:nucleoside-diphosphate-sugar epimerase
MKVMITGGAGFIGRWVLKKFLEKNVSNVDVLDNLSNSSMENIEEFIEEKNFGRFYKGSILEQELLKDTICKGDYDIVIHLAASINVQESIDNPRLTFNNDVIGTMNVLEAVKECEAKFIYVSTCLVYERLFGMDIDEDYPTNPRSPYAACKLNGEQLSMSYHYAYDIPVTILRPFNTYGPYQRVSGEGGVVVSFLNSYFDDEPLYIYGDGTQTRDFMFVEDCADFILKASLDDDAVGQIFNAGTGDEIEIKNLAELISGGEVEIIYKEHIHPKSEIGRSCCNYNKAKEVLGWNPQITLEKGIKLTRDWLKGER